MNCRIGKISQTENTILSVIGAFEKLKDSFYIYLLFFVNFTCLVPRKKDHKRTLTVNLLFPRLRSQPTVNRFPSRSINSANWTWPTSNVPAIFGRNELARTIQAITSLHGVLQDRVIDLQKTRTRSGLLKGCRNFADFQNNFIFALKSSNLGFYLKK